MHNLQVLVGYCFVFLVLVQLSVIRLDRIISQPSDKKPVVGAVTNADEDGDTEAFVGWFVSRFVVSLWSSVGSTDTV